MTKYRIQSPPNEDPDENTKSGELTETNPGKKTITSHVISTVRLNWRRFLVTEASAEYGNSHTAVNMICQAMRLGQ